MEANCISWTAFLMEVYGVFGETGAEFLTILFGLVSVMEMYCVFCEVQTDCLNLLLVQTSDVKWRMSSKLLMIIAALKLVRMEAVKQPINQESRHASSKQSSRYVTVRTEL
jgi:hypothetical protein